MGRLPYSRLSGRMRDLFRRERPFRRKIRTDAVDRRRNAARSALPLASHPLSAHGTHTCSYRSERRLRTHRPTVRIPCPEKRCFGTGSDGQRNGDTRFQQSDHALPQRHIGRDSDSGNFPQGFSAHIADRPRGALLFPGGWDRFSNPKGCICLAIMSSKSTSSF